jgi:hypothetical protein
MPIHNAIREMVVSPAARKIFPGSQWNLWAAGSALQTLGWRDCGQFVLIFAATSLLLYFRGSAP